MSEISTVVYSTFGTVSCPISELYNRLVISDRCKVRNYPNRVLSKSCRTPAGVGGQSSELERKLRQTYLLTSFSAKVSWLYDPFPFCDSLRPYNPGACPTLFPDRQVGLTPPS